MVVVEEMAQPGFSEFCQKPPRFIEVRDQNTHEKGPFGRGNLEIQHLRRGSHVVRSHMFARRCLPGCSLSPPVADEQTKERRNGRASEQMNEQLTDRTYVRVGERTTERTKERVNNRTKDRANERRSQGTKNRTSE